MAICAIYTCRHVDSTLTEHSSLKGTHEVKSQVKHDPHDNDLNYEELFALLTTALHTEHRVNANVYILGPWQKGCARVPQIM